MCIYKNIYLESLNDVILAYVKYHLVEYESLNGNLGDTVKVIYNNYFESK